MADPNLQIGGGAWVGGHPDPDIRGGVVSKKKFLARQASVWSKNKGGARYPQAPPLDLPLHQAFLLIGEYILFSSQTPNVEIFNHRSSI